MVAWKHGRVCNLGILRYCELGVDVDCEVMGQPLGEVADVTTTVITSESELDLAYAEIRRLKRIIQDYAEICQHSQAEIARLRSRLNDAAT